jgi:hypothetical protein
MAKEPEVNEEKLAARWPAKFAGKCNICRQEYDKGATVGIDPAKPFWYNNNAQKYQYNYAHADCIGKGARMLSEPEVKPYSFAPNAQKPDKFTQFVQDLRALCEAYLEA